MVTENKHDWDERLQEALWVYKTTHQTTTNTTPYSLVYGVQTVVPIETQVVSLRVAVHQSIIDDELKELDLLDEKRLTAQQRLQSYQNNVSNGEIPITDSPILAVERTI
ncbi:uncharacterized protein LOC131247047 [Magnolia sinica]|uniref:uncharacterized protein LOC131247047 n=1 Tax=Magnolia sinica TaxID=86752 RepID=UPI00265964E9|nr:uncharacterized protein LOC131247047 [Magnolia sinica]